MHIARIHLRSFKRFHDLTIEIGGTPHLVVMAGPNGLGKSSVIDALRTWHGGHGSGDGWGMDAAYHQKAGDPQLGPREMVDVSFAEPLEGVDPRKLIYARSAYRHEPDFTAASVQRQ